MKRSNFLKRMLGLNLPPPPVAADQSSIGLLYFSILILRKKHQQRSVPVSQDALDVKDLIGFMGMILSDVLRLNFAQRKFMRIISKEMLPNLGFSGAILQN